MGRAISQGVARMIRNASLGRVGDDDLQICRACQRQKSIVILIGIDAAGDRGNDLGLFHALSIFNAAHDQRVEPVLAVNTFSGTLGNCLADNDRTVIYALAVCFIHHPVGEGAEKVAGAKLQDFFRVTNGGFLNSAANVFHFL